MKKILKYLIFIELLFVIILNIILLLSNHNQIILTKTILYSMLVTYITIFVQQSLNNAL
jgi:hypothetical protein